MNKPGTVEWLRAEWLRVEEEHRRLAADGVRLQGSLDAITLRTHQLRLQQHADDMRAFTKLVHAYYQQGRSLRGV